MLNVTAMNSFETVTLFLSPCTRSGCCVHLPVPCDVHTHRRLCKDSVLALRGFSHCWGFFGDILRSLP